MKTLFATILAAMLGLSSASAYTLQQGTNAITDGSSADVQAAINAAPSSGWKIKLPSGTFTWTSPISVTKAVWIAGAGGGGFVGDSTTSASIGTGTRSFTMRNAITTFSQSDTIWIGWKPHAQQNWMRGTVTSVSGNVVNVSVSSSSGSGTYGHWFLAKEASTTIVNNYVTQFSQAMVQMNESTVGSVMMSDLRLLEGTGVNGNHVNIQNISGGQPIVIFNCWFSTNNKQARSIEIFTNRGIIHHSSFDCGMWAGSGNGQGNDDTGITLKWEAGDYSWSTADTMGMADTTGLNNFYTEDCYFAGIYLSSFDFDDNSRTAVRHCIFDNSGVASHGQETSSRGVRHFELYDNKFIFDILPFSGGQARTYNLNWWLFLRGGTGVITDNIVPSLISSDWGDKPDLDFIVMGIRRSTGDGIQYPNCPTSYPVQRQVGQGHNGSSYITDPVRIWNNTWGGVYGAAVPVGIGNYPADECGNGKVSQEFIVENRDYAYSARPGYTKYPYPHFLNGGEPAPMDTSPPSIITPPASVTVTAGDSAQFSVSAGGAIPRTQAWRTNGVAITGATGVSYMIGMTEAAQNGWQFDVIVSNAYGSVTSAVATLTVNAPSSTPPSISAQPQSIMRTEGESATFSVTASGDPVLIYTWKKGGVAISGATNMSYSITPVATGDAGTYTVAITNAYGGVLSDGAVLTVSAAPPAGLRYVDFDAGSDDNNGSASLPWKRCPGMVGWTGAATNIAPGTTVYFDRADTWTLSTNTAGPGLDLFAGVHYIGDEWDPETAGPGKAKLQAVARLETGVVRFWQNHATLPTWLEGFDVDGNQQTCNGVDINHSFYTSGLTLAVKRISDCTVHDNAGNGGAGDYKYGIIVSDNSPDNSGAVANVEIIDCTVYRVPRTCIALYPGDFGYVSNVVVRGCNVYWPTNDPSYADGHGLVAKGNVIDCIFEWNYSHDVQAAAIFINGPEFTTTQPAPTRLVIRNNLLQTDDDNGAIRFYGPSAKSADVYGNVILPSPVGGGLRFDGETGALNVKVYNNTFFNAFVFIGNPTGGGTIDFSNNILYQTNRIAYEDSGLDVTTWRNNIIFRTDAGNIAAVGGTNYSDISGVFPSGINSNPLFSNTNSLPTGFTGVYGSTLTPNTTGLSLADGSPGINAGITLANAYVSAISVVKRPNAGQPGWDIGAYEREPAMQPGEASPPRPARRPVVLIHE